MLPPPPVPCPSLHLTAIYAPPSSPGPCIDTTIHPPLPPPGHTTTVRAFAELAFAAADMPLAWRGEGLDEVGYITTGPLAGKEVVKISDKYFRPAEVDLLLGDPSKARDKLGWNPNQTSLEDLAKEMVAADLTMAANPSAYKGY